MYRSALFVFILSAHCCSFAGEADVINVDVTCSSHSTCDFSVTVRHADDGWEHYANRWEVRSLDGKRLAVRELLHPHDNEQPFTRSLNDVKIPNGVDQVLVRARDSRHRYGGKELQVQLPGSLASGSRNYPSDVEEFVARREMCDHFRGEEPYDPERASFLAKQIEVTCSGTDNELRQLEQKYKDDTRVMQRLNRFEKKVELESDT